MPVSGMYEKINSNFNIAGVALKELNLSSGAVETVNYNINQNVVSEIVMVRTKLDNIEEEDSTFSRKIR